MSFFIPDVWTLTHLFGSFFLVYLLSHLKVKNWSMLRAAALALIIGILWELFDESLGRILGLNFMDVRGFDWADVFADLIGCILTLLI